MAITFKNVDTVLFLTELHLQCNLAKRAIARLEAGRVGWLKERRSSGAKRMAPIEILEACHLLLLSSGVISKILFGGTDKKARNRGERLRALMSLPQLPLLERRQVRNAYEHIDERLDQMSHRFVSGVKINPLQVSDSEPEPAEIVLKRFCPRNMRIYFGEDYVDLSGLIKEMDYVREGINTGMAYLNGCSEKVL